MMRTRIAILALVCACGPAETTRDAGSADGATEIVAPLPPVPPVPPRFTREDGTCPGGWNARVLHEDWPELCDPRMPYVGACDPWERREQGTSLCRSVGRACAEDFPEPPEGARAIYVRAGSIGGDGTREAPLGTISLALSIAANGDAILLAPGEYGPATNVSRAVTIRGACAERTVVSNGVEAQSALRITARDVHIEDLGVTSRGAGIVVADGAQAEVRGVAISDTPNDCGITAFGALVADDFLVRGGPCGVAVGVKGQASVTRAELRGQYEFGVGIGQDASLVLEDSTIGAIVDDEPFVGGIGLNVSIGAHAIVRRSFFDTNAGIAITSRGGIAEIEDSFIASTFVVDGLATDLALSEGAHFTLRRVASYGSAGIGLGVVGAALEAEDCLIGFAGGPGLPDGVGIRASDAEIHLARTMISDSWIAGIVATDASRVTLEDAVILGTGSTEPADDDVAIALVVIDSEAALTRVRVQYSSLYGIGVSHGALTGTDLEVREVWRPLYDIYANAIFARDEGRIDLERVAITDSHHTGVSAFGVGTEVSLRDATISRITRSACLDEACESYLGGVGVGSYGGAHVSLERFLLSECDIAGAQIAHGTEDDLLPSPHPGEIDLTDGAIERNLIGVNVQVDGFDYARILGRVRYLDNERNIDATLLPVPPPPIFEM